MPTRNRHDTGNHDAAPGLQQALIRALQDPALYPHPATGISLLETHISWVILTGEYAYKIKKAVNFGFLDFSTLEKRHFCCQEELRLNRRFAPDMYLEVVALTGTAERPVLDGAGEPLEYAVRMRQFSQGGLLSHIAANRQLGSTHIDETVRLVATMHDRITKAGLDTDYGVPKDVHHWVTENFEHIRPALTDTLHHRQLDTLEQWCDREYRTREALLQARREEGFVRECHGDLHLGNLVVVNGHITPFDCIEFNPRLRWIDVISEAAFLVMDLQDRGYPGLAYRFLNGYLQHSGDYAGLPVLRYYLVYRALVRAKVAVLRLGQAGLDVAQRAAVWHEYQSYMDLTRDYAQRRRPALIITHGVSGSGKSWCASRLVETLGTIQLRSDIERKRLFGYGATAATASTVQGGIYSAEASRRTYTRLARLVTSVLDAGYSAIVDAAFLQRAERLRFRQIAATAGVPFVLLHCEADADTLRRRIGQRQAAGGDPSEAGIEVLEHQLDAREPLQSDEQKGVIAFGRGAEGDIEALIDRIAAVIDVPRYG